MRNPAGEKRVGTALIKHLVAERRRLGLSQRAIAQRMGVSESIVSEFESHIIDPHISTISRYGDALGWKLVWTPV